MVYDFIPNNSYMYQILLYKQMQHLQICITSKPWASYCYKTNI